MGLQRSYRGSVQLLSNMLDMWQMRARCVGIRRRVEGWDFDDDGIYLRGSRGGVIAM